MEEKKTLHQGPFKIVVKWKYDQCADLDFYGDYKDTPPKTGLYVDRKYGVILGDTEEGLQRVWKTHKPLPMMWDDMAYTSEFIEDRMREEGYIEACVYNEVYDIDDRLLAVEFSEATKILADDLPTMGHHEYRYFVPGNDYKEDDTLEEAVKYTIQDYKIMEHINSGVLCPMVCIVDVFLDGKEVGSDAMGSIISYDEDYFAEIEDDVIEIAMNEARAWITDNMPKLQAVLEGVTL